MLKTFSVKLTHFYTLLSNLKNLIVYLVYHIRWSFLILFVGWPQSLTHSVLQRSQRTPCNCTSQHGELDQTQAWTQKVLIASWKIPPIWELVTGLCCTNFMELLTGQNRPSFCQVKAAFTWRKDLRGWEKIEKTFEFESYFTISLLFQTLLMSLMECKNSVLFIWLGCYSEPDRIMNNVSISGVMQSPIKYLLYIQL